MADYKGLNIRFKGDSTEASKALSILSAQAKATQGNLTGAQNALKNAETNSKALNSALKNLQLDQLGKQADVARSRVESYSQILDQSKAKHEELRAEIEATKAALAGTGDAMTFPDGTEMSTRELAAHLNAVEEEERKVAASVEDTNRKLLEQKSAASALEYQHQAMAATLAASETEMYKFGDSAQQWGSSLQSVGSTLTSIGDKMSIVSGVAAIAFGKNIVSSTEEFGNAISQLGGYLDIQGTQLNEMSDQALKWGKDTQFSATEAAQAMNELAKGGMTQAQISGGAMKATMELAAAGELDMASAAEVAVQAIKTFGLSAEDSSAIADALAGAANKSTAEVTDLANGFKYVGGWASMANWNINDVSGALALLSDHGLRGEMAGTALRNVMQRLAAPTNTAAELMNAYGFSVRDAQGQMVSATEVVRRLNETFGNLNDAEKQNVLNDIFGARALPAAIALMDEGAESLQGYIDATTEAGYANEMAKNRMGELGWALEYLRGEAETAAVNFGMALTPTIKGAAEAIEDALEWFNSLSEAQQTQIANMALFVVGAGPVLSIVGRIASGFGGMFEVVGTGAKTLATFTQLMKDGGDAGKLFAESIALSTTPMAETAEGMQKVAEKSAAIESSLSSLATGAAVAGVVALTAYLVSEFSAYVEREQEFEDATQGLHNAITSLGTDIEASASAISASVRSWQEVRDAASDLNETQADIANSLDDSTNGVAKQTAMLDQYIGDLEELSGKSALTAGEQEKLSAAVKGINDILGTSVTVIDGQTGALNTNIDSIRRAADAYREYAQVQATMDAYTKVQEQIIENDIEMQRLENELQQARALKQYDPGFYIGDLKIFGSEITNTYHEVEKALEQAKTRSEELAFASGELDSRMDSASTTTSAYQQLLESLGIAAKTTGGDLSDAGDATDEYANSVSDAAEKTKKARQRENDQIYKEQQRAYDAEYKALQKALDGEYNALKKALDGEYKEHQKYLDGIYKAQKKAYDAEEDQLKKSNDQKLNAMKSANDKQEESLKKSLDTRYNEQKKALDAEVEAYKKANDAKLKELKKAQDAETKAFSKATDARIKEMEREYKAKLKQLEDTDGTKEIDARIAELKAETEAEKQAAKERQNNEKLAELQAAVDNAKTRRKKADAEKELNDFLEELAQERREQERENEIARLEDQKDLIKDETDAKKDALKEQYDAEKEAYKEFREQQLEAIKEANTTEYDTLKEKLDAELQVRKDAESVKLEAIKEANQAELDALKEKHDQQEEAYKEQLDKQLEAMQEAHEISLETLKDQQSQELDAIKEGHENQLAELKEAHSLQLEELKNAQQDALTELKNSLADQLDEVTSGGAKITKAAGEAATNAGEAVVNGIKAKVGPVQNASHEMGTKAIGEIEGMPDAGRRMGDGMGSNLASGIGGNAESVRSAARTLSGAATGPMEGLDSKLGKIGSDGSSNFASGIAQSGRTATANAQSVADGVSSSLQQPANNSWMWGTDTGLNYNNGLVGAWNSTLLPNINRMAQEIANVFKHSTPKEGPLKDDDVWFYHMAQNLDKGLQRGAPMLMETVEGIANDISDAMSGADAVDNLIWGMESKEGELAAQSRRMASIVEEQFAIDPSTNYSVGYDVRPMAQLLTSGVTEALRSGIPQRTGATIIVREMNVRSESDIRRVSQELYALEAQADRRGF